MKSFTNLIRHISPDLPQFSSHQNVTNRRMHCIQFKSKIIDLFLQKIIFIRVQVAFTDALDASQVCYYIDEVAISCISDNDLTKDGKTYNIFTNDSPVTGQWIKIIAFDATTKAQDPEVPPKFTVAPVDEPATEITINCLDNDIQDLSASGEPDDPYCKNSLDTSELVTKILFNACQSYLPNVNGDQLFISIWQIFIVSC